MLAEEAANLNIGWNASSLKWADSIHVLHSTGKMFPYEKADMLWTSFIFPLQFKVEKSSDHKSRIFGSIYLGWQICVQEHSSENVVWSTYLRKSLTRNQFNIGVTIFFSYQRQSLCIKDKSLVFPAKTPFKHCTESQYKYIFSYYYALSELQLKWDIVNRSWWNYWICLLSVCMTRLLNVILLST